MIILFIFMITRVIIVTIIWTRMDYSTAKRTGKFFIFLPPPLTCTLGERGEVENPDVLTYLFC